MSNPTYSTMMVWLVVIMMLNAAVSAAYISASWRRCSSAPNRPTPPSAGSTAEPHQEFSHSPSQRRSSCPSSALSSTASISPPPTGSRNEPRTRQRVPTDGPIVTRASRNLFQFPAHIKQRRVPISCFGLSEQAHLRIPGRINPAKQPAPIRRKGIISHVCFPQCPRQMRD